MLTLKMKNKLFLQMDGSLNKKSVRIFSFLLLLGFQFNIHWTFFIKCRMYFLIIYYHEMDILCCIFFAPFSPFLYRLQNSFKSLLMFLDKKNMTFAWSLSEIENLPRPLFSFEYIRMVLNVHIKCQVFIAFKRKLHLPIVCPNQHEWMVFV